MGVRVKVARQSYVCSWEFELAARAEGARLVAGVDEVGRGPLFGPVVAAAVVLPDGVELAGLTDSKKLKEPDRVRWDRRVREVAMAWAIAEVDAETIDRINILQASRLAMRLAVSRLECVPDCLLIDGNQRIEWGCRQKTIVKGDARSLSIAAASVIAKVYRDRMMGELDGRFPGYGLARNMGYPTAAHKAALRRLGATEMHRRSFRGVVEVCEPVELKAVKY
jgi:ribonuclease HII